MTKMEDCTAVLKHFKSISDLLGKETDYAWIEKILEAQRETVQNELESATKEFGFAKEQYEKMLARYEADKDKVDEGTRQIMEAELQAQYESMSKWQEKMLSKTEEFGELLNQIYENAVKKIGKVFEDAATKGQGWDSLLNSMDRVSAYQDLILTKTNQVYETNKLMNQLSKDIDQTDNVAHKTKLNNFKQEIQDMQNLNVMSKFDLDVAKARYEVLKAQIALEEAQNAKSTVRLQRDNEGNYGYVYTADQNDIDKAKDTLEEKQNDLYNLTLNKANENARALAELDKEMYAELERISLEYKDNEEKMLEERQRVIEEYSQRRSILVQDYALADYWQQQVSVTKTNEAYGDAYKQNLLDTEDWREHVSEMVNNIDEVYSNWTDDMDTYVRPTVGADLDELTEKTENLTKASEDYQDWFDDFADTNQQRLDAIADITHAYELQRAEIEANIERLIEMIDLINAARNAEANSSGEEDVLEPLPQPTTTTNYTEDDSSSKSGDSASSWPPSSGDVVSWVDVGNSRIFYVNGRAYEYGTPEAALLQKRLNARINDGTVDWYTQSFAFRTGGYTGNWAGDDGKFALLHQKELVLNADDTSNFLNAINIIREISSAIDLRAAASSLSSGLNSPTYESREQIVEQDVTIHAEFPNVTNHSEIEEAFNTLINRAAQFANRT